MKGPRRAPAPKLWLIFTLLLAASPARADTGMAFLELGGAQLFLVLLVVAGLEAWVLRGMLKLGPGSTFGLAMVVNLISWLAGLPLLWLVSNDGPLYALVNQYRHPWLSAGLVLAAFALSLAVEGPLLKLGFKLAWRPVWKACLAANLVSYLVLVPLLGPFSYFPDNGLRALHRTEPAASEPGPPPLGELNPRT